MFGVLCLLKVFPLHHIKGATLSREKKMIILRGPVGLQGPTALLET